MKSNRKTAITDGKDEALIHISSSKPSSTRSGRAFKRALIDVDLSFSDTSNDGARKKLEFDDDGITSDRRKTGKKRTANELVRTEQLEKGGPTKKRKKPKKGVEKKVTARKIKGSGSKSKTRGKRNTRNKHGTIKGSHKTGVVGDADKNDEEIPTWSTLMNRCSPNQLVKAIKKLNQKQRDAVEEMGFGKVLSLRMTEIPQKLGHYVVDKFDPEMMEIVVGNNRVPVDEVSVHRLLGLPDKGIHLDAVNPTQNLEPEIQAWRNLYSQKFIARSSIVERIAKSKDTSINFKLDFLVLFLSSIVECNAQGKCKYDPLYCFTGNTDIGKINWCRYIVKKMSTCKKRWERETNAVFKGPAALLTLLYVDSFTSAGFDVDRRVAPIAFWSFDMLKDRESNEIRNGGFGQGEYVGLSNPTTWPVDVEYQIAKQNFAEKNPTKDEVRVIEELLATTKENKAFIIQNLRRLIGKEDTRERAQKAAKTFEELFGEPLPGQLEGGFEEGATHSEASLGGIGGRRTGNILHTTIGENIPASGTSAEQMGGHTSCPEAVLFESPEEDIFPGFGTQIEPKDDYVTSLKDSDLMNDGARTGDSSKKIPTKPPSNPMFDVDISIQLAAAMFAGVNNAGDGRTEPVNKPMLEECLEINRGRLQWLENEDNDSAIVEDREAEEGKTHGSEGQKEYATKKSLNEFCVKAGNAVARKMINALKEHENQKDNKQNVDERKGKKLTEVRKGDTVVVKKTETSNSLGSEKVNEPARIDLSKTLHASMHAEPSFSLGLTQTQEDGGAKEDVIQTKTMLMGEQTQAVRCEKKSTGLDDGPSFSLGMTQLFKEMGKTGTNDVEVAEKTADGKTNQEKSESDTVTLGDSQQNLMKKYFNLPSFKHEINGRKEDGETDVTQNEVKLGNANVRTGGRLQGDHKHGTEKVVASGDTGGPSFSLGLTQSQDVSDSITRGGDVPIDEDSEEHETIAERLRRKFAKTTESNERVKIHTEFVTKSTDADIYMQTIIKNRYTPEEKAVWNLISKDAQRGSVLFDNSKIYISDVNVWRTMQPGKEVDGQIIDCMTCVLNEEDSHRPQGVPKRLFCSRDVLLDWMLSSRNNDEESRMVAFSKGLFETVGRKEELKSLNGIDMVFFPILEHGHYYLVVFELTKPEIYLLDNISEKSTLIELYDTAYYFEKSTAYKVKHLFVLYLRRNKNLKADEVDKCRIFRPELKWATNHNVVDCGIFTMRHMELFMGGNWKKFDCGFNTEDEGQERQIMTLRKKYVSRILLSRANGNRGLVLKEAGLV